MTADQILSEALRILQRNLPPQGVSDRETIADLWGLFDSPTTREILRKPAAEDRPHGEQNP
jgi:hypothetical protein